MALGSIALALVAGVLSTLSPCVLPLLPLVLGAALNESRFGPAALAAGLALSFVAIGLFVATIGYGIGLDAGVFRIFGAGLLIAIGTVLLVPALQTRFAGLAAPVSNWAQGTLGRFDRAGLTGQFLLGLLLGAVWSPCVGPTLGAASVLAAQGKDLGQVALTMTAFGIGAAVPLLALGLISRETMLRWRGTMLGAGQGGKLVVGGLLVVLGVLIFSGLDKSLEAYLVEQSPAWLTRLTTRF
jgi:cytochrome c-type biogenesis protein